MTGKRSTLTARERELFRYWQPEDHIIPDGSATDKPSPRSSSDPILTAFAQLGSLRLNARRGLITLSTRDNEYIIAESGKTLSIQGDDDEQDKLWHGVAQMKCKGLGADLVKLFCDADAPQYAVFDDVTKVDLLKDRKVVRESPFVRFLTCVPLRSPQDLVIGNYIVVDDKPREGGLSESEFQFMIDMGLTVMDYLEAGRVKRKQYRAERMVKAMGLFIEGRATLRDWWLQVGHAAQNVSVKKRTQLEIPLEKRADIEFGVQDPVDEFTAMGLNGLHPHDLRPTLLRSPSSSTLSHSVHGDPKTDGRPIMPQRESMFSSSSASTFVSRSWHERNSSATTFDGVTEPTVDNEEKHHSVAFDLPPENVGPDASKELQEVLYSSDLKGVFSRASNLIREAIAVDGVLFLDASIGAFGGAADKDVMEEKAPGAFDAEKVAMSSDEDGNLRRTSEPEINGDVAQEVAAFQNASPAEKTCNILGFSTRRRSSLRGHAPYEELKHFPETVLRRLLKRYPHGKVFNFEEDGSFSSSESDHMASGLSDADMTPQKFGAHERKAHRKRLSREAEAKAILSVLPKARSVFWFPLWDQSKERWFSGSMVWSTLPTRVLCPVEDLTYLAAFGNNVMAEVSRLSAQVLAQMKTDFISSISHELRSPLHGVLASVEFLQETSLGEVQTDMVDNIQASANVLLDTLNHVLDFSKVNRKSKNKGLPSAFRPKRSKKSAPRSDPERQILDNTVEDIANVCVLSEEVVESIYAGRSINKRTFDAGYRQKGDRPPSGSLSSPVTIIMDVNYHPSWKFEIDAGAWRRILMNLFSNALKYTTAGFVQVSLQVESDALSRSKKSRSILTLRVKDSGKGISQEFLKHRLFKPFVQEDSLATGAGLGLSIVRHIVHDLGGEISFASEQGVGTEATVRIPLTSLPARKTIEKDLLVETRSETKGLKFSLEGFDRYPDISETPTGILSSDFEAAMLLKTSVHNLITDWFEMEAATSSDRACADVVVIMDSGSGGKPVNEILQTYHCASSPVAAKSIAIVFSTSYPTGPKIQSQGRFKVFYSSQPYGPHKIAKMMHSAFCNTTLLSLPSQLFSPQSVTSHPVDLQGIATSPLDALSPKSSNTSHTPSFPFHLPRRRHSVQPGLKSEFAAAMNAISLQQLPESPIAETHKTENGEGRPREASRDKKASGEPIVKDPKGMRVLLVDDNEINLKLLVAYMRKLKLNHATACNGLEAVNAYKDAHEQEKHFDVIFMDISMPIMSGIESTQHIRRFEREHGLQPVALIALTGAANPTTRQEAFSSGVDLFLTKPVPMKSLKVMLDDLKANGRSGMSG